MLPEIAGKANTTLELTSIISLSSGHSPDPPSRDRRAVMK
jgi:hypothetical protein